MDVDDQLRFVRVLVASVNEELGRRSDGLQRVGGARWEGQFFDGLKICLFDLYLKRDRPENEV